MNIQEILGNAMSLIDTLGLRGTITAFFVVAVAAYVLSRFTGRGGD
jgi:hypothetical protein